MKHPEASRTEWIERVLDDPVETQQQSDGRIRYWGKVLDENGIERIMRVITLEDHETVHNAFFDRSHFRRPG